MPEVIVAEDAQPYIRSISFDEDVYSSYLLDKRGVAESDIEKLSLVFTNKGLSSLAIASTSPGFLNDGDHIIRISPTRISKSLRKQGNVLRHETEHFIQGCNWQYKAWVAGQLSFVGASSISSGFIFAQQALETFETAPEVARASLTVVSALGGMAMGAVVGSRLGAAFGPLEIGATIAERSYRESLPDGTLRVNI